MRIDTAELGRNLKRLPTPVILILTFLCCLVLGGCFFGSSEEDQVRELLSDAETAIEEGKLQSVRSYISDSYIDDRGRNKKQIEQLVGYQILTRKSIHIFTSISSIEISEEGLASVELLAALTGTPVTSKRLLLDLQADIYRFNFTLSRSEENSWLVTGASWQPAMMEDLFEQE